MFSINYSTHKHFNILIITYLNISVKSKINNMQKQLCVFINIFTSFDKLHYNPIQFFLLASTFIQRL